MARSLHRGVRAVAAILVLLCLSAAAPVAPVAPARPAAASDQSSRHATLATWNIRLLGHGQQKDFAALGEIVRIASFDFLALQEVMTEAGLDRLRASVEHATGTRWESLVSHAVGTESHKEMYAFLWNPAVVEYVSGATIYLDITDQFAREPYSARFRVRESGQTFVAANVHIVYGKSERQRTPEIEALLDYWQWLQGDAYPESAERILLMGDFNLKPSHPAWAPFRAIAEPLIADGASTLSSKDGIYANLYDNAWMPIHHDLTITERGVFKFPDVLGWTHEEARNRISDHAPVWLRLGPTPTPTG